MKLFLAIFVATLAIGPALALALYMLGAFAVDDLPLLMSWLTQGGENRGRPRPELGTLKILREHGAAMLVVAYGLGGLPAAAGGAFLGWRSTRTPPRLGLAAPLALGGVLGLMLVPILRGMRLTLSSVVFALIILVISLACAACCWAVARLIHRAMAPQGSRVSDPRD